MPNTAYLLYWLEEGTRVGLTGEAGGGGGHGSQYNFPPRLIACGNLTTLVSRGIVYGRDDQTSTRISKVSVFQTIHSRRTKTGISNEAKVAQSRYGPKI